MPVVSYYLEVTHSAKYMNLFTASEWDGRVVKKVTLCLFTALLANASSITVVPAGSIADAQAARQAWLTANFDSESSLQVLETFAGYGPGFYYMLSDNVGTWNAGLNQFAISGQQLQSQGAPKIHLSTTDDTLFFFATGVGGLMLTSGDGTKYTFPSGPANAPFYFVGITSLDGSLDLVDSPLNNYGIADVGHVQYEEVPEPAPRPLMPLAAATLIAIEAKTRRRRKHEQ